MPQKQFPSRFSLFSIQELQSSIEFSAEAAASKYSEHLPLTRQARIMGYEGLVTDSQTLVTTRAVAS
jgi:transposase